MARRDMSQTRSKPLPVAPAEVRPRRPRRRYVVLGLIAVMLVFAGALVGYAYFNGQQPALATVDGQRITSDDYRARLAVEKWRIDYREAQLHAAAAAGRLSPEAAGIFQQFVNNDRQSVRTEAMESLIDARLKAELASQMGVSVTDQQVQDALVEEATTPEQRHVWVIGYRPAVDVQAGASTPEEIAAARARAEQALADIRAGADWADIARLSDDDYAGDGGDAGFLSTRTAQLDEPFTKAVFTLPANATTEVIEGDDGEFRIGRVSEIVPPNVDGAYEQKIKDAGVSMDAYRTAVRADVLARALDEKVVSTLTTEPAPQRRVREIFVAPNPEEQVKARMILFAPADDPAGAASLPAGDPAWSAAEQEAKTAYDQLTKDPSGFADLARQKSDDPSRSVGGELGYRSRSQFEPQVAAALFDGAPAKGQVLSPIKTAQGWEVLQFVDRRAPAEARIADIAAQTAQPGADFAALAQTYSERDAASGGDLGWVARYQLDSFRDAAVFGTPVGSVSTAYHLVDGYHIFQVEAEEVRTPDASQVPAIKVNGPAAWYSGRKKAAAITRNYSTNGADLPSP